MRYVLRNISSQTINLKITRRDGSVGYLAIEADEKIRGIDSNGARLLRPYIRPGVLELLELPIESGKLNWLQEGF